MVNTTWQKLKKSSIVRGAAQPMVLDNVQNSVNILLDMKQATKNDPVLQQALKTHLNANRQFKSILDSEIQFYYTVWSEVSDVDGILYVGNIIIVPKIL